MNKESFKAIVIKQVKDTNSVLHLLMRYVSITTNMMKYGNYNARTIVYSSKLDIRAIINKSYYGDNNYGFEVIFEDIDKVKTGDYTIGFCIDNDAKPMRYTEERIGINSGIVDFYLQNFSVVAKDFVLTKQDVTNQALFTYDLLNEHLDADVNTMGVVHSWLEQYKRGVSRWSAPIYVNHSNTDDIESVSNFIRNMGLTRGSFATAFDAIVVNKMSGDGPTKLMQLTSALSVELRAILTK